MSIAVLWNPSARLSGRSEAIYRELERWPDVRLFTPMTRAQAIETVAHDADQYELFVAAGGDGTVNSVGTGILDSKAETVLGILPLGTGNDLARSLNIPLDWMEALQVLREGRVKRIDALHCKLTYRSRWVLNMLTGGNTGRFLEAMDQEMKQRWGPFCYLRGVIDLLQHLEPFHVRLSCDDAAPETFDALNLFFANGRMSGGGLNVSPHARLDDGLIDVIVIREGQAGQIAELTAEYFLSDYLQHELVEFRRARRIQLESIPPLPLTADGDLIGGSPAEITIHEQALNVLVPGEIQEEAW